jgi:hypothetical protein
MAEVAVLGGLGVDGPGELEQADDAVIRLGNGQRRAAFGIEAGSLRAMCYGILPSVSDLCSGGLVAISLFS